MAVRETVAAAALAAVASAAALAAVASAAALAAAALAAAASAGGGGVGGGAVDMANPPVSSGGISIKNASAHDLGNGAYTIDFLLMHALSTPYVQRVDRIRVAWAGESRVATFVCSNYPWTLHTDQSAVITVHLVVPTTVQPRVYSECGSGPSNELSLSGSMIGKQPKAGDTIKLGFDGILDDATPFALNADATVL